MISIITPSYNQGEFIERTILSVINQEVKDLEYWVIDGGSTDETIDILKKYEKTLKWVSEPDEGQGDAVNKGILRSKGDIIGWLNSDDVYYPGTLQKVLQYFKDNPNVLIIYGAANHIDDKDAFIESYPTRQWNYEYLFEECFICQPAVFFRRELVEEIGLLDKTLQYCMDYEYWLRIGKKYQMVYFPELLAGSRLYPNTKTLGARRKVHEEILGMVYRKTGVPPIRWMSNLGHVIAREKGLNKSTMFQELRFIIEVCKVICFSHFKISKRWTCKLSKN